MIPDLYTLDHLLQWVPQLLHDYCLVINGEPYLLRELEFYYYTADHPDPFCHRHPLQDKKNLWYLHRHGTGYRGGTYKGLDLTFGEPGVASVGILLRTIKRISSGALFNGPCNIVDHLLNVLNLSHPRELDKCWQGYSIWDEACPVHLYPNLARSINPLTVYRSRRVGLSKKLLSESPRHADFYSRTYRWLVCPDEIKKGRTELISTLLERGVSATSITQLLGCRPSTVTRVMQQDERRSNRGGEAP